MGCPTSHVPWPHLGLPGTLVLIGYPQPASPDSSCSCLPFPPPHPPGGSSSSLLACPHCRREGGQEAVCRLGSSQSSASVAWPPASLSEGDRPPSTAGPSGGGEWGRAWSGAGGRSGEAAAAHPGRALRSKDRAALKARPRQPSLFLWLPGGGNSLRAAGGYIVSSAWPCGGTCS